MPAQTRQNSELAANSGKDSEPGAQRRQTIPGNRSQPDASSSSWTSSASASSVVYNRETRTQKSPPPPPPTVESQLAEIRYMIRNLNSSVDSCRDTLNRKIDCMEKNIQDKLSAEIKHLQDYVDMNISQVVSKMETLEKKVDAIEEYHNKQSEYNTDCTIVARGLVFEEGEDLEDKASTVIRRGLGLHDVPVVRAKRMRSYGNRPGVVKIQLQSLEHKKRVLRAKMQLKQSGDFSCVYLNPSHTHTERLMDMNFRTSGRVVRAVG